MISTQLGIACLRPVMRGWARRHTACFVIEYSLVVFFCSQCSGSHALVLGVSGRPACCLRLMCLQLHVS